MGIAVEAQQAWIESVVYQMDNLSKADGNRLLGGTTALIKVNILVFAPSFQLRPPKGTKTRFVFSLPQNGILTSSACS